MTSSAAQTIGGRLGGEPASRTRALLTAAVAGAVVTGVTYRWLRRGAD
jgi:hypothetical protein